MIKFTVGREPGLMKQPSFDSDFQVDRRGRHVTVRRCDLVTIVQEDLGQDGLFAEITSNGKRGFVLREDVINWPDDCTAALAQLRETTQKSFAESCLLSARIAQVNAPALIAIAFAESKSVWEGDAATGKIKALVDEDTQATGPFQYTQEIWDAFLKANPKTGLNSADINDPLLQTFVAAELAHEAWEQIKKEHKRNPNTLELYIGHLFGPNAPVALGKEKGSKRMKEVLPKILEGDAGKEEAIDKLIERRADLLKDAALSKTIDAFRAACFEKLTEGLGRVDDLFRQLDEFQAGPDGPEASIPGGAEFVAAVLLRVKARPGLNKPDRLEAARMILESFAKAGYGQVQQLAALANAVGESALDRTAHNTSGEDSVGLFQLNRQNGVGTGHSVESLKDAQTNIDLIIAEVERIDKNSATKNIFLGATTLDKAVDIFVRRVERPRNPGAASAKRLAIARELMPQISATASASLAINGPSAVVSGTSQPRLAPLHSDFVTFFNGLGLTHFKPSEFLMLGDQNEIQSSSAFGLNSPPPQQLWPNIAPTARLLDQLREILGFPVLTTSVYRTQAYNRAIGGATNSEHMAFRAVDFRVSGTNTGPQHWANTLRSLRSQGVFRGGIGTYSSFVHVDTRGINVDF